MKLYGLFCYYYDYYEWEDIVIAAFNQKDLIDYYHDKEFKYKLIWSEKEHEELKDIEQEHYLIKEIELINSTQNN